MKIVVFVLIITSFIFCSASIHFYLKCRRLIILNQSLSKKIDILEQHLLFSIDKLRDLSHLITNWSYSFKSEPKYNSFHKRFSYKSPDFIFSNIIQITNILYDNCIQNKLVSRINLTSKEIITCCLLLHGFTPTVISTMLEYKDAHGVYVLKRRLKVKLNLSDEDGSLEMYLRCEKSKVNSDTPRIENISI